MSTRLRGRSWIGYNNPPSFSVSYYTEGRNLAARSYEGFFSRYVSGTKVPPYETIFDYAGYQVDRTTRKLPNLGANVDQMGRITGVPPGPGAGTTPLQPGASILSIDGQTLEGQGVGTVFRLLIEKAGQNIRLRIRRGGEERELEITAGFVEVVNYRILDSKSPTPEQLKIRESWLVHARSALPRV